MEFANFEPPMNAQTHNPRSAGVLLHISSLPGAHGIGTIGPSARSFLHQLKAMGQSWWQMLPLGPTGYGDSPYQCLSSFAGNELLISLEDLMEDGLLTEPELTNHPEFPKDRVDFSALMRWLLPVHEIVTTRFSARLRDESDQSHSFSQFCENYSHFCNKETDWLEDYALFKALKKKFSGRPWNEWPQNLRNRDPEAMALARNELKEELEHTKILQFLFHRQWSRLREEAASCGIKLIGDIPIFVAHDSADVWARQDLFHLDESGSPTLVAGVPPDYFSETGQLWGNPLYRWEAHEAEEYAWWAERLEAVFRFVDTVRIDHFRGFEAYWEIPAGEETAINGKWVPGPGLSLFDAIKRKLGELPIIAEDLGLITEEVHALRKACGFPGMRVAQFSFGDPNPAPTDLPSGYAPDTVAYSGTHDNETLRTWLERKPFDGNTLSQEQIDAEMSRVAAHIEANKGDRPVQSSHASSASLHWPLIETMFFGPATLVILPLQDILELGPEARMNQPGTTQGNWQWRTTQLPVDEGLTHRLKQLTASSGRS